MAVQTDSPTLGRGTDWNSFYSTEPLDANNPFSPSAFGQLLFAEPDAASARDLLGIAEVVGAITFADIGGTLSIDQLPPGSLATVDDIGEDALYFFTESTGLPSLISATGAVGFISGIIGFSDLFGTISLDQFPPGSVANLDSIDEDGFYFFDNTLFVPKLLSKSDTLSFLLPDQTGQDGKFLQTNAGVLDWAAASGGGVVDGQQLFDGSHVLSADFGTRQLLASDGTSVGADWSTPGLLETAAQIRFSPDSGGNSVINIGADPASPTVADAQDAIVIAPSDGLVQSGHGIAIGNHVWTIGNYGMVLSSGFAGGKYSSVIGGDGGATHPATRASCVGTTLTVVTDMIWSDAAAFNSHIRNGDLIVVQSISDRTSLDARTVSSVAAATLTLSSAPTDGDGEYHVFVVDAGQYGQQVYSNPPFDCGGDAQVSNWLLGCHTTDATATRLVAGDKDSVLTPDTQNQIRIFTGQVRAFQIHYVALKDNGTTLVEIHKGAIKNVSGTVSLVGSVTSERWADTGASAWTIATTADNTDKLLACTFTGASSSNIRVMGHVKSTEVAWFPAAV